MITDEMLEQLREQVSHLLSPHRYNHTLGVERMAAFLAGKCLPDKVPEARVAALLHDITKELSEEQHLELLLKNNVTPSDVDSSSAALLHSQTAPFYVLDKFGQFASPEILSAIEKHTTADTDMSILDKIIFLADFIEDTRPYPDSKSVSAFVKDSMTSENTADNISVLDRACVMEIDSTISSLKRRGRALNPKTLLARDALISKK